MTAQLYSYSGGKYTLIPASYVNTYYLRKYELEGLECEALHS